MNLIELDLEGYEGFQLFRVAEYTKERINGLLSFQVEQLIGEDKWFRLEQEGGDYIEKLDKIREWAEEQDLDEIDLNEPSWFRFIFKVKRAQDIDFENKIELYGVLALFTEQLAQDISPSLYWESEIHEDYVEHEIKFWVSYGS